MTGKKSGRKHGTVGLWGSSMAALLCGMASAPLAAQQATPASPQCTVNSINVVCTGALPNGFEVPTADRDIYTRLTLRNLTAPINASAPDGVAIDFFNDAQPVSVTIDTPDTLITSQGASYPRGNFIVGSSSAVGVRARTRSNVSIVSNADITIDADTIDYGAVELVAGLAADMIQTGTATRDLTLRNSGDITITSNESPNSFTNQIAGIWAGYSGLEGLTPAPPRGIRLGTGVIENIGSITVERGAGIMTSDLDYGTLDVLNSGTITASGPNGDVFAYGINIEAGAASNFGGNRYQTTTVRNTGTITVEDRGATAIGISLEKNVGPRFDNRDSSPGTVVNDGRIIQANIEGLDFGTGIRIEQGVSLTTGNGAVANMPGSTLTATNNGTIDVSSYGISVQSNANRVVTNTGTINITTLRNFGIGVLYDFSSPSGSDPTPYNPVGNRTTFTNSATGIIRVTSTGAAANDEDSPSGVVIYGGDPVISNAGLISATGRAAVGLSHIASFQIFGSSGIPAIAGTVNATNSGTIEASGANAQGLVVSRLYNSAGDARNTTLTNSGTISATGDGAVGIVHSVAPRADRNGLPTVDPTIANLGTATLALSSTSVVRGGSGTGAAIRFTGGATNTVTNAGLIAATSGNAIVGGTAVERIDNSGRIEGSISLAAGDDRIDARAGGIITGAIDGGDGNDTIGFAVASGTTAFADRVGGVATGFELLEKTGGGILTVAAPVVARVALNTGGLASTGANTAMAVDAAAGTALTATGSLGAVTLADGATLSPGDAAAGSLTLAALSLSNTSRLFYNLGTPDTVGGPNNDLITITGNLTLDGLLDVTATPAFGDGVYRLINYGGTLTDNGLAMGIAPGATYNIQTSVAGQVNLMVGGLGDLSVQFWDDGDTAADGGVDGGVGIWAAGTTNWTSANGAVNNAWAGNFAVFQTTGGDVTVNGTQSVTGMQFAATGYRLLAGTGGSLNLNAAEAVVRVDPGLTAELVLPLTGTGALVKRDTGTLILSGSNSYAGGTQVTGGVLQVASDASLGAAAGRVTLDGGTLRAGGALTSARGFTLGASSGTLDTQGNAMTLSGALSGTGGLAKTGSGTLTLSGNSGGYAGPVTLGAGTLNVGGTLGSLVTVNAGTLNVTGALNGGASINAGRFNLSGSVGGTTTIASGATLSGTGTLANLVMAGTLSPGNSIGTLTTTGNVTFRSGSFYDVELNAAGGTDLLRAGGTATLEGGTVRIATLDPDTRFTDGSRYTILSATGGLTGTFAGLTESSAFLDFALGYDANTAFLTVDVIRMFPDVALTFNQAQSSTALATFNTGGTDALAVYNQILLLDAAPARAAFDLSSGEIYAATLASGLRQGAAFTDRLLARSTETGAQGWGIWGGLSGHTGRIKGDDNAGRVEQRGFGADLGLDYRGPDNGWALGISGGYVEADTDLDARSSSSDADGWRIGGYARYGSGGVGPTISVSAAYSNMQVDVARAIAFGTLSRTARGSTDLDTFSLGAEFRYGLPIGANWSAGPLARATWSKATLDRLAEAGADSLNLGAGDNNDKRTRLGLGLFARYESGTNRFDLAAGYATGGRDPSDVTLALAGAPGTSYRVRSPRGAGDGAFAQVGAGFRLGGGWSFDASVRGTAAKRERAVSGNIAIGWRF